MKLKRLLALTVASILLMSTMTMTAGAAVTGGTGDGGADQSDSSIEHVTVSGGSMTFTTTLNMSETAVTAPATTFTYTLSEGSAVSNATYPVTAGVMPTTTEYTTTYATTDIVTQDSVGTNNSIPKSATIDFTTANYTAPGIYAYVLTATANTDAGIAMDASDTRYIYVYVENGATDESFVVSEIIMYTDAVYTTTTSDDEAEATVKLKSEGFVNSYGIAKTEGGDAGSAGDVAVDDFIITAYAAGSGADYTKEFTYTLTSGSNIADGTIFKVETTGSTVVTYIKYDKTTDVFYDVTLANGRYSAFDEPSSKEASIFLLSSGETYTIHSVVNGMSFEVEITDEDGYTMDNRDYDGSTSWEATSAPNPEDVNRTVSVVGSDGDNEGIDFLTYYELAIPATGVILQYLPFALLGLLALAFVSYKFYRLSVKR